ncbi:MAG TPA: ribonucleoside-diphosphate reductase subunit alpha [Planctomycetes bacterium]|nr:ribonucleoside-diphosphate reductase subunit alpha [Planctomycetota bacterium]HIL38676.1 ribonucleoside-diphosphate reductase subunit alpha [Planctomycetota bacterium]
MQVRKRNGGLEPVDLNKIVRAVSRCADGLSAVDPMRIATRTISGLYDGASTEELDRLSIHTSAALIAEEPQYRFLAARLLGTYVEKEVQNQNLFSFSQSIQLGHDTGLIQDKTYEFVMANARKLNDTIQPERDHLFGYFGLRTVYDRYLLKHPETRKVLETPQYFFMRVACGLADTPGDARDFYALISSLRYLPSSPTLFNSGTRHTQLSSCYLLDSPADDLKSIYDRYQDIAQLSKFAGGIGVSWSRVRSRGSLIRGTNGESNGIVPWLKTLDSSVAAVNQGGRRKGAACVYLETWHADIEEFLELRDNTGDEARRTHNLNLANWVPDLFMERVEADENWSLFDPKTLPQLTDTFGDTFRKVYLQAEKDGLAVRSIKARNLYGRMMRTLAQTGNGWMTFKDASNLKCNQTATEGNMVHLSNLCTEILEITKQDETAVCNLGSVNLSKLVLNRDGVTSFDFDGLGKIVCTAMRYLDKVIDVNFYPTPESADSNSRWRPVGLGCMGLQDVFFQMRLPFDSEEALTLSTLIQEHIYLNALRTSCELAKQDGPHRAFDETRAAKGDLQFDLWGIEPTLKDEWEALKKEIAEFGLRNSLTVAIAPTATIATIAGCYECIEPQVSNLFKRETLSGDFVQVNNYLVDDLKQRGLWNEVMRSRIKQAEGSISEIDELPEELRTLYRTAWELPQKSLIDLAAARGPYIDQSQSLNLFMASPTIGKLSSMYAYAWRTGLKTTYYLRSRPATRIRQTTVAVSPEAEANDSDAVTCSLENPESCEACQ